MQSEPWTQTYAYGITNDVINTKSRNNPDANYVNWYHWFYLKELFVPLQWYHFCWAFDKAERRVVAYLNGESTSIDEVDEKLPPDIMPQ